MNTGFRLQRLLCSVSALPSMWQAVFIGMFLLLDPVASQACQMYQPLTETDLENAQSVFIGEAIRYRRGPPAIITFRVTALLSGRRVSGEINVYWVHGTFGSPRSLASFKRQYGSTTRVGILFSDAFPKTCKMQEVHNGYGKFLGEKMTCYSEFIGPTVYSEFSDLPWVLNKGCSGPYMFPAD